MPNQIKDIKSIDSNSFPYIFEQNITISLKSISGVVRCNVYRPKNDQYEHQKYPAIVTYGPYGKDIHYKNFHSSSYAEVNPQHHSEHASWETPDPGFWTGHGYVVVRADEVGCGQSPGVLDTMSRHTSDAFADVVEWAAEQSWCTGKVGLLGISYYAGSQWRVAARQPKGLAAIIPWEGMSDYYRDRCRQGGILSDRFIKFWWDRQVLSNQYGLPGRADRNWGLDTIEGDLSSAELCANRNDQNDDNAKHSFRDEAYYASKEYNLGDVKVPVLSVANWGGICLHLRGNVQGYTWAGSEFKYLRFICGRHDLPFYYEDEVKIQLSFLSAFLKGEDDIGWSVKGKVPPVSLVLRQGDVGYNNPAGERQYKRREELEWPLSRTQYTRYFLAADGSLANKEPLYSGEKMTYKALGTLDAPEAVRFTTEPFQKETEITGHVTVQLNISASPIPGIASIPSDIDLFVTLRHLAPSGKEVSYTGTAGDPVPLTKGWLRVSVRRVDSKHRKHREWLPWRNYSRSDVMPVIPGEVYPVLVEIWPTNVVLEEGARLVLEVASGDTQGCGIFRHEHPIDRSKEKLEGYNHIHFDSISPNFVTLPIIPAS